MHGPEHANLDILQTIIYVPRKGEGDAINHHPWRQVGGEANGSRDGSCLLLSPSWNKWDKIQKANQAVPRQ